MEVRDDLDVGQAALLVLDVEPVRGLVRGAEVGSQASVLLLVQVLGRQEQHLVLRYGVLQLAERRPRQGVPSR